MPAFVTNATTRRRTPVGEIPGILANAVRRHVSVMVYAHSDPCPPGIPGAIVGADSTSVVVRLLDASSPWSGAAPMEFSVVLWVDGVQYAFDTLGTVDHADGDVMFRLTRPTQIDIVERRRSGRRPLRTPSAVGLQKTNGSSDDPQHAVMMNVSPHGLACRVDATMAEQLSVGTPLTSIFTLEPNDQTFSLPGRIVNITQGGTPGQAIIGIEFTGDEISQAQKEALSAALACGTDA